MQITYEEWYERTAAMLMGSDLPEAFVEDCLTNREAMHELYQQGYAAAEVVMHIRRQYRLKKQEEEKKAASEAQARASTIATCRDLARETTGGMQSEAKKPVSICSYHQLGCPVCS